jgi:proline iminopeptidase
MVEHRGVGMSRHDNAGADLTPEALTIEQVVDDIAAVLDDADVQRALLA